MAILISDAALPHVTFWLFVIAIGVPLTKLLQRLYQQCTLPFKNLQGPPADHWLFGNYRALIPAPNGSLQDKWFRQYGDTLYYSSSYRKPMILTKDPLAVDYIHRHSNVFLQGEDVRMFSQEHMGPSLTAIEGSAHRRQRKAIAPSFGANQIRVMFPQLLETANIMADRVVDVAGGEVDMVKYINAFAVDAIGHMAFGTDIGAQNDDQHPLMDAFRRMMFRLRLPGAKLLHSQRQQALEHGHALMKQIGMGLIEEKRKLIRTEAGTRLRKEDITGHDLMTVLLRQNMAKDVRDDQRMSDEEVLAQIPLFLFAGNNTVAVTLAWAIGMLAKRPLAQQHLRDELQRLEDDAPDWETINKPPYLEAFTRELLRLYAAAPTNFRYPQQPTVLPLSTPVKDVHGRLVDQVKLPAGTQVHIAYGLMNTATDVFGEDAWEFDPSRWLEGGKARWEDVQTFGGGDRHCIGSRLATAEVKTALFALVQRVKIAEPSS